MNVLVCIPCLMTGGTEIQTLSLVQALAAAGHSVVVACYFEHDDGMVARYRDAGADLRLLSADGLRPEGIRATTAMLWRGLRSLVRETQPDAAHVQYMAPGALPILILRALGVKNILATAHTPGDIYSPRGLNLLRAICKRSLRAFQCITLRAEQSFFGSASLFNGSLPQRRGNHFTIYNTIPSYITPRNTPRPLRSENTPIIVGVVSRLEPIKGMDFVVPAFAQAAARDSRLHLLVVGDGSQRTLMEQQAMELDVADRVEFAGRQAQDALQAMYDRIDILLMPSRSEGFGLTAVEGMARGCVPVVADTGGLPEVVQHGINGLVHPPADVDAIADAISSLSHSPKLLSTLSNAAIDRANEFSQMAFYDSIRTLYTQL